MAVRFLVRCLTLVVFSLVAAESFAQAVDSAPRRPHYRSAVLQTKNLEERIEFWVLIFTKYGEDHRVFHHRDHPEIIYSVLDVSEYNETLKGRPLVRAIRKAIKDETTLIRGSLRHLGSGGRPRNDFEDRLEQLFATLRGGNKKYRIAAEAKRIRIQTGIKERFRDGIRRSGRYLYAIEKVFNLAGTPWEISRLPLVESSFDYNAYSSAGAAGIWQFIRSTGRRYLRISAAIDERRDPIVASQAAAQYLLNSYEKLGNWPLAITSYNHGLAGIMRAVKKTGSKDLSVIIDRYESRTFGFASQNFYCEFVAAFEVEQNWQHYFPDLVIESPWYVDEVRLTRSIRYRDVLRASGLSDAEFRKYNRALKQPVLSNRARIAADYVVKVPKGKGMGLIANLGGGTMLTAENSWAYYQAKREGKVKRSYDYYVVRKGDTVGRLARKFGVSQRELMSMNGIRNARYLRLGMKLRVPDTGGGSMVLGKSAPKPKKPRTAASKYKVKAGETVGLIARRHSVSVKELMQANGMKDPRTLKAGQVLKIPGRGEPDADIFVSIAAAPSESYIVKKGETLSDISERFGVPVATLKKKNRLRNPRKLQAGAKLQIPAAGGKRGKKGLLTTYTVKAGDTLSEIARAAGISTSELMKLNSISDPRSLSVGKTLQLSKNSARARVAPKKKAAARAAKHTVKKGETLERIAAEYGTTVSRLVKLNGIKNPEILVIGKTLTLPGGAEPSPKAERSVTTHVVQQGESLASIAKKTGISVARLIKLNPGAGDLIYPGQQLALD